ncbi:hypothetical protein J6590_033868 [Homalodisca vitripennis]|nr:hypothetical protein J6590_033868 [Homalodisca vitripennis]
MYQLRCVFKTYIHGLSRACLIYAAARLRNSNAVLHSAYFMVPFASLTPIFISGVHLGLDIFDRLTVECERWTLLILNVSEETSNAESL